MDPVTLEDVPLWTDYAASLVLLDDAMRQKLYKEAMTTEATWKSKAKSTSSALDISSCNAIRIAQSVGH